MSSVELFYSDSDSDTDNENNNTCNMAVKRRKIRDSSNPLELPNTLFIKYFRLNKEAFNFLLSKIEEKLKLTRRSCSVPPILKLAATLRFLAEGSYQTGTGNEFMAGLAQPTFSKILSQVCRILEQEICPQYIRFPTTNAEKDRIKLGFFEKFGFPGVIGCVDGTHVKIIAPPKQERHLYMNRKGFYSLNVMIVCDDQMRITYVDSSHPGSCHDSFIFNSSDLDTQLKINHENGETNTWLLGDSGYALKPYIITPFRSAEEESRERHFNTKHSKARNIVERTIGVLKNRFRCVLGARQLHYSPEKSSTIINVCCAFHNLCVSYNIEMENIEQANTNTEIDNAELLGSANDEQNTEIGQRVRNQLINAIF